MRKCVTWIAIGTLVAGCQTHAAANEEAARTELEAETIRLTEGHGDVVLFEVSTSADREVALMIRYEEKASTGGPRCSLFIVERSGAGAVLVEESDGFLTCNNAPGAERVRHALEARVERTAIRLEEQHVRSHSTFDFARATDGRWHLVYGDHVGPENRPDSDDLLLVSNTVAYTDPVEGPTVSDFSRAAVSKDVVRSVIE